MQFFISKNACFFLFCCYIARYAPCKNKNLDLRVYEAEGNGVKNLALLVWIIHRSNIPHSLFLFSANNNCCSHNAGLFLKITLAMVIFRLCHSIFARSLARSSFSGPHGMSLTHAACDQPLMNSPITKLKFCHSGAKSNGVKNLKIRID